VGHFLLVLNSRVAGPLFLLKRTTRIILGMNIHDNYALANGLLKSSTTVAKSVHTTIGSHIQCLNDLLLDLVEKIYLDWEDSWGEEPSLAASQKNLAFSALKGLSDATLLVMKIYKTQTVDPVMRVIALKEATIRQVLNTKEAPPIYPDDYLKEEPIDEEYPDSFDSDEDVKPFEEIEDWNEMINMPSTSSSSNLPVEDEQQIHETVDRSNRNSIEEQIPAHIDMQLFSFKYPCVICFGDFSTCVSPSHEPSRSLFFRLLTKSAPHRAHILKAVQVDQFHNIYVCWKHYPDLQRGEEDVKTEPSSPRPHTTDSLSTTAVIENEDIQSTQATPCPPVRPPPKLKVRMAFCSLCNQNQPTFVMSPRVPHKIDRFYDSIKAKPHEIQLIEELRASGRQHHICEIHFKTENPPVKKMRLSTEVKPSITLSMNNGKKEGGKSEAPKSPMWQYCDM
ncbi:hypothetical protein PFISCL1PPCAC_2241, partial [Pristionchus fissidentatus]